MEEYGGSPDASLWPGLQVNSSEDLGFVDHCFLLSQEANGDFYQAVTNTVPLGWFPDPLPQNSSFRFFNPSSPVLDVPRCSFTSQGLIDTPSYNVDQDIGYAPVQVDYSNTTQATSPCWNFDASSSSTISEVFSPSSEQAFPISPISSGIPAVPSQLPYGLEPEPMNIRFDFNTWLCLGLPPRDWGTQRLPVPSEPQPRRRTRSRSVGRPHTPARIRHQILRPVKCPFCGKGHQYQALLDRHLNVHHHEELGKAKQRHDCPVSTCPKQYARSDHAYRHAIKAHGWPPGGRKRGSRSNADGGYEY